MSEGRERWRRERHGEEGRGRWLGEGGMSSYAVWEMMSMSISTH